MDSRYDTYQVNKSEYGNVKMIEVDTLGRQGYYAIKRLAEIGLSLMDLLFFVPVLAGAEHSTPH